MLGDRHRPLSGVRCEVCVRILRNLRGNVNIIDINKSLFKSEWLIISDCTIILWESAADVCTCTTQPSRAECQQFVFVVCQDIATLPRPLYSLIIYLQAQSSKQSISCQFLPASNVVITVIMRKIMIMNIVHYHAKAFHCLIYIK